MSGAGSRRFTLDEAFPQPSGAPQTMLESSHLAGIALVIIAKKVQQSVEGQHANLGAKAVPRGRCLALRDALRNDDVAEEARLICWKRKDIGDRIRPPIDAVQVANAIVGHDGDRHRATGSRRRHRLQPPAQSANPAASRDDNVDCQPRVGRTTTPGLWRAAPCRRHKP